MGRVLLEAGQREEAIVHLRRHLELRPNAVAVLDLLATSHAALGDLAAAEECLLRALELKPGPAHQHRLEKLRARTARDRA